MKIRAGYDIAFHCFQEVPMLLMLSVHPSRQQDLLTQHAIRFSPNAEARDFRDAFGNVCTRLVAPPGLIEIRNEFLIADSGLPDETDVQAEQWPVGDLPGLLRICWAADTAIRRSCRTRHGQCSARSPAAGSGFRRSATTFIIASNCRDFAHLAVTLCRCMNIPARYCTGYLGDFGVPRDPAPMDFSAWFEVFLDGHWYTFDARHNHPRIGRIVIARGRDAADVAISTTFGSATLARFTVVTDEVVDEANKSRALETAAA